MLKGDGATCTQCGYVHAETNKAACVVYAAQETKPARPYFANDPGGLAYDEITSATPRVMPFAPPPTSAPAWTPPVYAPLAPQPNAQSFQTLLSYAQPATVAGRDERLFAWLIDTAGFFAAFLVSSMVDDFAGHDFVNGDWIVWFIFLSYVAMQTYLLSAHGQTLGKRALGLRIVKADTLDNGGFVANVLSRWWVPLLVGVVSCGLFTLIDILCIFGDERKCVHDNMAGTIVIKDSPQP